MHSLTDKIQKEKQYKTGERGFSLIELIIVLLVVSILTVLSVITFRTEKKYLVDTEAYQIIDLLNEARQRSLTQHKTFRVEFNQTRNAITLISENEPETVSDDKEVKSLKLRDQSEVVVGVKPENVYSVPTELSPTPALTFKTSVHPLSKPDKVATLRFVRTGIVLDAGSNADGDNAAMTGATVYVWTPEYTSAGNPLSKGAIIRAITVQGTSGLSKYWKCPIKEGGKGCDSWVQ
jgi:prepilin-type N-terminal cleavage/methylation domain-containing protein